MMSFVGLTTIDFRRESNLDTVSLKADGNAFEILGVTVRNDLKWNEHVDDITAKASRRIYLLTQLVKHADIDPKSLIQFYCACIHSILEYTCQAFHSSLPAYLSDQIERVQKRVLRADVSKYQPEVYKSEKSEILKKIHKVALGKLLT